MQHPGELIRKARQAKGITLKKMSKQLGIPVTTINSWERGNGLPKSDNRAAVAKYLEIDEKQITRENTDQKIVSSALADYESRVIMMHKNVWAGFEELKFKHEDIGMFLARIYTEILSEKK